MHKRATTDEPVNHIKQDKLKYMLLKMYVNLYYLQVSILVNYAIALVSSAMSAKLSESC